MDWEILVAEVLEVMAADLASDSEINVLCEWLYPTFRMSLFDAMML